MTTLNSSNVSGPCQDEAPHASIITLMLLIFFLGFLLNVFSLWAFCCRFPTWTSGTLLQFHLAISDAMATPVIPMMAVYFAKGNVWRFGHFLCQVKIALLSCHFCGSTVFLMLISIHRYISVVHFNRSSYLKQKNFVRKLCAGIWCGLLIQALIYGIILPPTKVGGEYKCLSVYQAKLTDILFVINFIHFIVSFLLPFFVSAVCYGRLALTLTSLNINSAKGLKVKVKSQRMIGVCLLIFGVCLLPLNVIRTVGIVSKKYYPGHCRLLARMETIYYVSWIFAGVNTCLDPLLYCFGSQNFRDAFGSFRIRQRDITNKSDSETTANQL